MGRYASSAWSCPSTSGARAFSSNRSAISSHTASSSLVVRARPAVGDRTTRVSRPPEDRRPDHAGEEGGEEDRDLRRGEVSLARKRLAGDEERHGEADP